MCTVCERRLGWVALDPSTGTGAHLQLMNDSTGTGMEQNVKITPSGAFVLEGYAATFDSSYACQHIE